MYSTLPTNRLTHVNPFDENILKSGVWYSGHNFRESFGKAQSSSQRISLRRKEWDNHSIGEDDRNASWHKTWICMDLLLDIARDIFLWLKKI